MSLFYPQVTNFSDGRKLSRMAKRMEVIIASPQKGSHAVLSYDVEQMNCTFSARRIRAYEPGEWSNKKYQFRAWRYAEHEECKLDTKKGTRLMFRYPLKFDRFRIRVGRNFYSNLILVLFQFYMPKKILNIVLTANHAWKNYVIYRLLLVNTADSCT